MEIDRKAFWDRVLADSIAAPLRDPEVFVQSKAHSHVSNWENIDKYVRMRAEAHRVDLFASEADRETAIEEALRYWAECCKWKGQDFPRQYRILAVLGRIATSLLEQNGTHMIPRICAEDPCREILRWRFVSLVLPPGILMAAAADKRLVPARSVQVLDRSIAPDGEVAELHLHHAAISSFESVWASLHHSAIVKPITLQRALQTKKAACPKMHLGDCPKSASWNAEAIHAGHLADWCDLLQQSFIARYLLRQHSWHQNRLLKDCDECNRGDWQGGLRFFILGRSRPKHLRAVPYPWQGYRLALERRWREGTRPSTSRIQRRSSDAILYETVDEQSFLIRALTYTRCSEGDAFGDSDVHDPEFESLLIQYLRIKTALFGLLVHAPGERGLDQFLTHFSQIKIYAPDAEMLRPQTLSEPGLSIAAKEYRVAADAWLAHHRRFTRAARERTLESGSVEKAWLVHLKRAKHVPKELPLFRTALRGFENDEDRIGRLIESQPNTLRHLRGIDVAELREISLCGCLSRP